MNPIILVSSCWRDRALGAHQAIRRTWGASCPIPYRFLLGPPGRDDELQADEIFLAGAPDDMGGLACKTRQGHAWAAERGYDYIFQAFTDTYIVPAALLLSGFENHHYVGHFPRQLPGRVPGPAYAFGGPGYWLSPRATRALLDSSWPIPVRRRGAAEDWWVGTVLSAAGIDGWNDPRYHYRPVYSPDMVSCHVGRERGRYDPAWLYKMHVAVCAR